MMNEDSSCELSATDSVATANDVTSPRRSGRSRLSTTMQIQGHTVLRKNNYKVVGTTYVYDEFEEDAPKEPSKKKPKTTSSEQKEQVQRECNPAAVKRKKHNQIVEDSVNQKSKLRTSFLAERLDKLKPFVEDKVLDSLLKFKASDNYTSNETSNTVERKPVQQPKMIEKAILRPYQLKGLDFMVRMHEKNLAMILGDEMGLVGSVLCCVD